MGTCFSGEEEAKATSLVSPSIVEPNPPCRVLLKKQGAMDMDYDVIDLNHNNEVWMLVDTVGGIFSSEMKYFLKHRTQEQEEAKEESTVLAAAALRQAGEFEYKITDSKRKIDWDSDPDIFSLDSDSDDGDIEITSKFKAKWKFSKEIFVFSDYEMEKPIAQCKVKCKGKYKRKTTKIIDFVQVPITNDEGEITGHRQEQRVRYDIKHKNKLKQFVYKMSVNGQAYALECKSQGGSFFRARLMWTCTNQAGEQVFAINGDGHNATVETFGDRQELVPLLMIAFAVGVKFDPSEIQANATGRCKSIPDPRGRF